MTEPGKPCANCETVLQGGYCHVCGQKASELNRPFWWILGEFLDSVFSYDSRTLRTIWLLFADPGEFTRLYNSGKRASVLPPFRTFIVATVVFFLALQMTGVALIRFGAGPKPIETIDTRGVVAIQRPPASTISVDGKDFRIELFAPPPPGGFQNNMTSAERDVVAATQSEVEKARKKPVEDPENVWFQAMAMRIMTGFSHALEDPTKLNGPMNIWLPRALLVLVPFLAVLLALMHWRPRAYYIEHLIFSLHIHTVAFVALSVVVALVGILGGNGLAWGVAPILAVYVYMAMLRVYQRGPLWTAVKFVALFSVYGIIMFTAMSAIFVLALSEI
jgi:hypothetical protein